MNFQLRRFAHDVRRYLTFDVLAMIMILLFLVTLHAAGCYRVYMKLKMRDSRGAAAGLIPAPAAEPEAPRR